jgi:hypothetical protein
MACHDSNAGKMALGATGIGVSIANLVVGAVVMATARGVGAQPLSVVAPGDFVARPTALTNPRWQFAGVGAEATPGGALVTAAIRF